MTVDERFERIEHVTAALVEERRKDREEFRNLWRDTQRQLNELSGRVVQIGDQIIEVDTRLGKRIEELAQESREADKRLEQRVDKLVSAIGQFVLASGRPTGPPKQP